MKTRIEEMVESCYGVGDDGTPQAYDHLIEQALTEAHQAGMDEAVEVVKSMKRNQDSPKEGDPYFTGCGGCGEAYPAICGCREVNQALDDIIKALQDKNSL